ncbi:MAG: hypothetical protein K2X60_02385 [Xanthobacteraceae bacterium]|nr:hypothetical protein [Xanthobacteraceae bacterium]
MSMRWTVLLASLALIDSSMAFAQSAPDTENGRYSMSQVGDGFLRLDTRTGAVSNCTSKGGWTCRIVPDERAALDTEIGRLQGENKKLKDQLAQREGTVSGKTDAPLAKDDSQKKGDSQKKAAEGSMPDKTIELQLPPEHAKIMAMFDRMWQRLVEMATRVQKKLSEKI